MSADVETALRQALESGSDADLDELSSLLQRKGFGLGEKERWAMLEVTTGAPYWYDGQRTFRGDVKIERLIVPSLQGEWGAAREIKSEELRKQAARQYIHLGDILGDGWRPCSMGARPSKSRSEERLWYVFSRVL